MIALPGIAYEDQMRTTDSLKVSRWFGNKDGYESYDYLLLDVLTRRRERHSDIPITPLPSSYESFM